MSNSHMRVIFMGTPDFAVPALAEIIGAGHEVVRVYTQPPRKAGRGMEAKPGPVQGFAKAHGIEVATPVSLKESETQVEFAALEADVAVVVAYGMLLPKPILQAPRLGCLNLHASRLPRWRGAAPIQRAIMAGDKDTAVAVMQMEEGLDTGPVCLSEQVPIGADMSAGDLHDRLSRIGASLITRALAALEREALSCTAQSQEGVSYAAKIEKAETRIDWQQTAEQVQNHIRGLSPFPGAWLEIGDKPQRIKVLRSSLAAGKGSAGEVLDGELTVACGSGAVRLLNLQRSGKGVLGAAEFLRGIKVPPGTRLK